jgi:hypothetical protein
MYVWVFFWRGDGKGKFHEEDGVLNKMEYLTKLSSLTVRCTVHAMRFSSSSE